MLSEHLFDEQITAAAAASIPASSAKSHVITGRRAGRSQSHEACYGNGQSMACRRHPSELTVIGLLVLREIISEFRLQNNSIGVLIIDAQLKSPSIEAIHVNWKKIS